ncbi:MAG TPA: SDR family NAD(P)-dependent oxidoreductase [Stellaceae bacterium]|jgi:short-subunit dehydrogenase
MTGRRKRSSFTGASAGVGRAAAREFAARGARLGLIARRSEGLEAATEEVRQLGGSVWCPVGSTTTSAATGTRRR